MMKTEVARWNGAGNSRRRAELASIRPLALLLAVLLAGVGAGVWWLSRSPKPSAGSLPPATKEVVPPGALSQATRAVLGRLTEPVEIRFYSVLNETQAATTTRSFAERVSDLLGEYERSSGGKIGVKRLDSPSISGVRSAAMADGIEPQRLGTGEMSFLGLAVICRGERAVIPRLAPEWVEALEFDLSRAIARVVAKSGPVAGDVVMNPSPASAVNMDELLRAMPEIESLSLVEARQKLRESALEEFKAAAGEMQMEIHEAQRRLAQAQGQSSEAEEAARRTLQELHSSQNQKLSELSQRMEARIAALEQMKGAGR